MSWPRPHSESARQRPATTPDGRWLGAELGWRLERRRSSSAGFCIEERHRRRESTWWATGRTWRDGRPLSQDTRRSRAKHPGRPALGPPQAIFSGVGRENRAIGQKVDTPLSVARGGVAASDIDGEIARRAAPQHGIVTRRQLLALGVGEEAVAHRARVGRLLRVHQGVYAVGHRPPSPLARAMASRAGVPSRRRAQPSLRCGAVGARLALANPDRCQRAHRASPPGSARSPLADAHPP
ncbi:MAG: type IV toxin-antitoxin system AbiEi family antitoxin domain-containing protein [Solirubrobacteraceae bacterium]